MKRLYKWIASAGMMGGMVLPATVTCDVPDINVAFVPGYNDEYYYEDEYYEEYYYEDDYYEDDWGFDFGFGGCCW